MGKIELAINLQETNGNGKIKLTMILIKGNDVLPDFFISDAPITQCTWNMLKGPKTEVEHSQFGIGEDYPMYYVDVQDCKDFISVLNGQLLTELQKASQTSYAFDKFELPTEEQWEFVAREGNERSDFRYSGSDEIEEVAWYKRNSDSRVHEIKTKLPNALGVYDMSGNVMEWCKKDNSNQYVTRGGSWYHNADECRVDSRSTIYRNKQKLP